MQQATGLARIVMHHLAYTNRCVNCCPTSQQKLVTSPTPDLNANALKIEAHSIECFRIERRSS